MERFEYKHDGLIIREITEAAERDIWVKPLSQTEISEFKSSVNQINARLKWQFGILCTLAVVAFVLFVAGVVLGYPFIESLTAYAGLTPFLAFVFAAVSYGFGSIKLHQLGQSVCIAWNRSDVEFNGLTLVRCHDDDGVNLLLPAKPGEIVKLAELVRDPGKLETGIRLFLATIKQEREITSLEVHLCIALSQVWARREEYRAACAEIEKVAVH